LAKARRGGSKRDRAKLESSLSQVDADLLIGMEKICLEPYQVVHFKPGMGVEIDFVNDTEKERFRLIIERSEINTRHAKYELLARHSIPLLRLEIAGATHYNPDGTEVPCPHLHIYRPGFRDRYAKPMPHEFGDPDDPLECLRAFLGYCNAVQVPRISQKRGLFP